MVDHDQPLTVMQTVDTEPYKQGVRALVDAMFEPCDADALDAAYRAAITVATEALNLAAQLKAGR